MLLSARPATSISRRTDARRRRLSSRVLRHADGGGLHPLGEHPGADAKAPPCRGIGPDRRLHGAALVLLFGAGEQKWSQLVFPAWVLMVSIVILLTRPPARPSADE